MFCFIILYLTCQLHLQKLTISNLKLKCQIIKKKWGSYMTSTVRLKYKLKNTTSLQNVY